MRLSNFLSCNSQKDTTNLANAIAIDGKSYCEVQHMLKYTMDPTFQCQCSPKAPVGCTVCPFGKSASVLGS